MFSSEGNEFNDFKNDLIYKIATYLVRKLFTFLHYVSIKITTWIHIFPGIPSDCAFLAGGSCGNLWPNKPDSDSQESLRFQWLHRGGRGTQKTDSGSQSRLDCERPENAVTMNNYARKSDTYWFPCLRGEKTKTIFCLHLIICWQKSQKYIENESVKYYFFMMTKPTYFKSFSSFPGNGY